MNIIENLARKFILINKRLKRWHRQISTLAAVVVFATTYAMILPAITLDSETASTQAGMEVAMENETDVSGDVYEDQAEQEESGEEADPEEDTTANKEDTPVDTEDLIDTESDGAEESQGDTEAEDITDDDAAEEAAVVGTTVEEIAVPSESDLITEDIRLTFEGEDYTVFADFGANAKLLQGVELQVREITAENDPEEYDIYYNNALSQMQDKYDEYLTLSFARFYDITFVHENAEIEPSGDVTVRIEYKDAVNVSGDTSVDTIYFDKNDKEKAEVIDSEVETESAEQMNTGESTYLNKEPETVMKAVEFKSEKLSVYGIVGTEIITSHHITAEGETYIIIVSYGPEAQIPDDARLEVSEISEDSEFYSNYVERAKAALGTNETESEKTVNEGSEETPDDLKDEQNTEGESNHQGAMNQVVTARFFDITIVDAEGNGIQPAAPVDVRIECSEALASADGYSVVHFGEDTEDVIDPVVSGEEGVDAVDFQAESFSVYGVVGMGEITASYLSANGKMYRVTVSFGPEAQIPEEANLSVIEFDKNSDEFKSVEKHLETKIDEDSNDSETNEDTKNSVEFAGENEPEQPDLPDKEAQDPGYSVIDISILDKNGEKIEPAAEVSVKIEMVELPEEATADSISKELSVLHLVETEQGIEVETVLLPGSAEVTEDKTVVAEFQVKSFSSFVIDWTQSSKNYIDITVYYVNQNGTQIQGPQTTQVNITANSNNINLHTYSPNGTRIAPNTITTGGKTYTFGEARYNTWNGDTIQWIQTRVVSSGTRYIFFRSDDQHTAASNPSTTALLQSGYNANSARYYWNSVDMITTTGTTKTAKVYLVYTDNPNGSNPGGSGGSGDQQNPLGTPEHNKTLTQNKINGKWDGTYTLSLDVKGVVDESNEKTNADVLIILDTSSSMRGQKWTDAKNIILEAANTLFSNNTTGNTRVRIALETFNDTAWKENSGNFYTSYNSFISGLNNLAETHTPGSSGVRFTNWEQALKVANDYTSKARADAEHYVIFVSDGNPTIRETKGFGTYAQDPSAAGSYDHNTNYAATTNRWGYGVDYGTIPAATTIRCYTTARPYARQLVNSGWNFYAIGAWTDQMLRMTDLVDFAYTGFDRLSAPSGHAFNASDSAAVQRTFNNLVQEISKNFGYTGVKITDELSISASTSLDVQGHASDFKYYKDGVTWSGAPAASYNTTTRTVNWNLSSIGELGDSTYTVSFTVWPNQDAYDALLELSQGVPLATVKAKYPSIADYITTDTGGAYAIKSNKNAELKFKKISIINGVSTTGPEETAKYTFPSMSTLSYSMKVSKVWADDLYPANRMQSITFQVYEDNEPYGDPITLTSADAPAGNTGRWEKTIPISPGIISTQVLSDGTALNAGHNYTVREIAYVDEGGVSHTIGEGEEGDYHYEFSPEIVKPMLNNGVMRYQGDTNGDASLSGTNTMRGSVTIAKKVVNQTGTEVTPNEPFTIRIYLKDKNGNDITGKTLDDSDAIVYRTSVNNYERPNYVINNGDTVTLKAGEGIRLINVPIGVQYKIEEVTTGMPVGYEYISTDYSYTDSGHTDATQTAGENGYYITAGNTFHYVTVTNKLNYTRISLRKVDTADTSRTLTGAKFQLCTDTNNTPALDFDGDPFVEKTILNDGSVTFDKIVDGTYYLIETESPIGFNIAKPILVNVSSGIVTYQQEANNLSQNGEGITFSEEDNTFTLVITNSSGVELPLTGGSGTLLYTLSGLVLIFVTVMMYGFRMRRRERRLKNSL